MQQYTRAYCDRSAPIPERGPIPFVVSTEVRARDGKVIEATGWSLEAYQNNNVVLWCHDYSGRTLPIGRAEVQKDGNVLRANITFDPDDPFAQQIERKYRAGYLHAVSVGWRDLATSPDGRRVTRAELLDISAVPVPGDPKALIQMQRSAVSELEQELAASLSELQGVQERLVEPKTTEAVAEAAVPDAETGQLAEPDGGRPFVGAHSCRLHPPGDFQPDTFRTMERVHEGKPYTVLLAKLKGGETMTEQGYRYPAAEWTDGEARAHCEGHEGIEFAPALPEPEEKRIGADVSATTQEGLEAGPPPGPQEGPRGGDLMAVKDKNAAAPPAGEPPVEEPQEPQERQEPAAKPDVQAIVECLNGGDLAQALQLLQALLGEQGGGDIQVVAKTPGQTQGESEAQKRSITDDDKLTIARQVENDMTAAEVVGCHRRLHMMAAGGTNLTGFTRADMEWFHGIVEAEMRRRAEKAGRSPSEPSPLQWRGMESYDEADEEDLAGLLSRCMPGQVKAIKAKLTAAETKAASLGKNKPKRTVDSAPLDDVLWQGTANLMVAVFQAGTEMADSRRRVLYNAVARLYALLGKEPPELQGGEALAALGVEEIRGLFLEGELDHDHSGVDEDEFEIAVRAGAVLSAQNRQDLEQAVTLIQSVLGRAAAAATAVTEGKLVVREVVEAKAPSSEERPTGEVPAAPSADLPVQEEQVDTSGELARMRELLARLTSLS